MGTSENLAWFVGHNTLRGAVGIVGDKVTEEQMLGMEVAVTRVYGSWCNGVVNGT